MDISDFYTFNLIVIYPTAYTSTFIIRFQFQVLMGTILFHRYIQAFILY